MSRASPVRAFRDYHGLTLRELSVRSGIAPSYLSEIEQGRKPGSVRALARVAESFGVAVDALLSD